MSKCDFNKAACNFIETTFQHGCFPINLLHIFRAPFYNNTSGGLLLNLKRLERPFISFCSIHQVEIVAKSIYL